MGWIYHNKPPIGWPLDWDESINNGLVGCGLFNEGSGNKVSDLSGYNNTGTLTGTVPSWSSGNFGSAVLLPGTDEYINIPHSSNGSLSFGSSTDFTLSIWVKPYSGGNLISKDHDVDRGTNFRYGIYLTTSTAGLARITGDGTDVYVSFSVVAGVWNHVVAVFKRSGNLQVYVNGVAGSSADISGVGDCDNSQPLELGYERAGIWFNGQLDIPMIYNRALSPSEIALLYREPFCGFMNPDEIPVLGSFGVPPVGMAGAMTTNSGYWGW